MGVPGEALVAASSSNVMIASERRVRQAGEFIISVNSVLRKASPAAMPQPSISARSPGAIHAKFGVVAAFGRSPANSSSGTTWLAQYRGGKRGTRLPRHESRRADQAKRTSRVSPLQDAGIWRVRNRGKPCPSVLTGYFSTVGGARAAPPSARELSVNTRTRGLRVPPGLPAGLNFS